MSLQEALVSIRLVNVCVLESIARLCVCVCWSRSVVDAFCETVVVDVSISFRLFTCCCCCCCCFDSKLTARHLLHTFTGGGAAASIHSSHTSKPYIQATHRPIDRPIGRLVDCASRRSRISIADVRCVRTHARRPGRQQQQLQASRERSMGLSSSNRRRSGGGRGRGQRRQQQSQSLPLPITLALLPLLLLLLLIAPATAAAAAAAAAAATPPAFLNPSPSPPPRSRSRPAAAAAASGGGGGGGAGGLPYGRQLLTPAERLRVNEPLLREVAGRLQEAGMGKTHIVQDKSMGPGLHSQHYRWVGLAVVGSRGGLLTSSKQKVHVESKTIRSIQNSEFIPPLSFPNTHTQTPQLQCHHQTTTHHTHIHTHPITPQLLRPPTKPPPHPQKNKPYRFETTEAGAVFIKVSPKLGAIRMLESQAESLRVIGATQTLRWVRT
jgi:hypothetical protein